MPDIKGGTMVTKSIFRGLAILITISIMTVLVLKAQFSEKIEVNLLGANLEAADQAAGAATTTTSTSTFDAPPDTFMMSSKSGAVMRPKVTKKPNKKNQQRSQKVQQSGK